MPRYHKYYINWPGLESRLPLGEAAIYGNIYPNPNNNNKHLISYIKQDMSALLQRQTS